MENNERDRKLDQWLDEALSEYSAAEPRFGLEQRVLKRIRGEEQRSRKRILWRWMPVFGAIAAVIVVAVAVRPMLERKPRVDAQMNGYLVPSEQKGVAANELPRSKGAPLVHNDDSATQLGRKYAAAPRGEARHQPRSSDRDALSTAATEAGSLESRQSNENKAPATNQTVPIYNAPAAPTAVAVAPPPSPPPPESATDKDTVATAAAAPTAEAQQAVAQADEVRAPSGIVGVETLTKKSLAAMEPKSRKNKREAAKAQADRENANVIDAFGVKVRIMNGLTAGAQQFPTPSPLSNQEKLALALGRELTDSAITRQKSTDITPLEIKNIEIKPLEGPEKQE